MVLCVWCGGGGGGGDGGADLSVHGKSLSMNHDDATNSGGRTPGSKLPASPPHLRRGSTPGRVPVNTAPKRRLMSSSKP